MQHLKMPIRRFGPFLAGCLALHSIESIAACDARSTERTAALVELYTSEGCSSCPPADAQLRALDSLDPGADIVPLSLHVTYWDGLGWSDRFAQRQFDRRQSALVGANGHDIVYTPQFFVAGAELRSWRGGLRQRIQQVNASPAAADLRISATPAGADSLSLAVTAHAGTRPAALYVAVTESGLVSRVTAGENGGVALAHDHVVRALFGPLAFTVGDATFHRELVLPPDWNRAHLEVVAFVSNERTGTVLQALKARECAAP